MFHHCLEIHKVVWEEYKMSGKAGKKIAVIGVVLGGVVAAALLALGKGHTKGPAVAGSPGKELFPIKTITRKDCSLAPWLVAEKLGFFTEEGIRIVYTGETQDALIIPSILRGDNDVWGAHPNTIAVAKAGGAGITGVFRGGIDPPPDLSPRLRHMFWYVNPTKYPNVKSFADLKNLEGKLKFSTITANICTDFLTNRILDGNGIPRDKVEWVTMPDIQAVQALKQGLVDVAGVHPPFYTPMDNSGARKIADSAEVGLGPAAGGTYTYFRDDFITKHPQVVKGFIRAMGRSGAWINAHPELAAKWTSEVIGVPVTGNHYHAPSNEVIESEIEPWIRDLEEHKVIPPGKIKPSDLVTHQFETHEVFSWK